MKIQNPQFIKELFMTTLPPINYSPNISNTKLNPSMKNTHRIAFTGVDSVNIVNNAAKTETIPTKMLLSLLKSGLSGEKADTKIFNGITYNDWVKMYNLSLKNAITPLVLDGIRKNENINVPNDVLENMERSEQFTKKYHSFQEKVLKDFTEFTNSKGVNTVQMKGIGLSMDYPEPQKRFGGDIDVYTFKKGTDFSDPKNCASLFIDKEAKKIGNKVDLDHGPKHSIIKHKDMPIENHRNFLNVEVSPLHRKMNTYLLKHLNPQEKILPHGTKILVPSKEFNTVFISFHAMQHFVGSGINFHHLADWAVHVNKHGLKVPEEAKGTKFEEFMYALTNLTNKHLGTNVKVPENKKLEDEIFNKIIDPNMTESKPQTKNIFKIFQYKCKNYVKHVNRQNEYWGEGTVSLGKSLMKSLIYKIKNPKTIKNLIKI